MVGCTGRLWALGRAGSGAPLSGLPLFFPAGLGDSKVFAVLAQVAGPKPRAGQLFTAQERPAGGEEE